MFFFFRDMTAAIRGEDCVLVAVFANVKIRFGTTTLLGHAMRHPQP